MLLAQIIIVYIVRRRDLEAPCSEFTVNVFIKNDGHVPIGHGHTGALAMQMGEALVFRVNANGRIAHDGLGTGRGDG